MTTLNDLESAAAEARKCIQSADDASKYLSELIAKEPSVAIALLKKQFGVEVSTNKHGEIKKLKYQDGNLYWPVDPQLSNFVKDFRDKEREKCRI